MFQLPEAWLSLPKALQVFRHLSRERQVAGKEAFDLFDTGAGILGQCVEMWLIAANFGRRRIYLCYRRRRSRFSDHGLSSSRRIDSAALSNRSLLDGQ
jgi:hypothetical protein